MLFKKTSPMTAIALGLGLALLTHTHTAHALDIDGASSVKDLIPIQRPLASVEPYYRPATDTETSNATALEVTAWVNKKEPIYRLGETVNFYIKVNKDAYITLMNMGTTGKTHIIFPNRFQRTNFVKAGEIMTLPQVEDGFDFKVTGKKGREVIKVIATEQDVNIIPEHYTKAAGPYRVVTKDLEAVANGINSILNNSNAPQQWDEYTKVLTIK